MAVCSSLFPPFECCFDDWRTVRRLPTVDEVQPPHFEERERAATEQQEQQSPAGAQHFDAELEAQLFRDGKPGDAHVAAQGLSAQSGSHPAAAQGSGQQTGTGRALWLSLRRNVARNRTHWFM